MLALFSIQYLYESERESREVPDLSTLFFACTSTDAYQSVSVRDLFSIHNYISSLASSFMLFSGLSVY